MAASGRKAYPPESKCNILTRGFLIPYTKYQHQFLLDPELSSQNDTKSNILVIYAVESGFTRITCYPIKGKEVWKIKIQFTEFSPELLERVGTEIKSFQIVHTTGMCQFKGKFYIGYYLIPWGDWLVAIKFIDALNKINGLTDCSVEQIILEK